MSDATKPDQTAADADRRGFLKHASRTAMAAGLLGGYGGFAAVAVRYLYPSRTGEVVWQFVTEVAGIEVGQAIRYRGPSGETINIARRARNGDADDFIALSSTCPHLGCQVRWEGQNNRFHCPCHNGVFDPSGKAIAGPPGEAGQSLPRYALKIEDGVLHIAVPPPRLASDLPATPAGVVAVAAGSTGPGHDPCLDPAARPRTERRDA
jgi:nitrite reductase/ring-hydroxylating ferredoxin subunit